MSAYLKHAKKQPMRLHFHFAHKDMGKHGVVMMSCSFGFWVKFMVGFFYCRLLDRPLLYEYVPNEKCQGWEKEDLGKPFWVNILDVYARHPDYVSPPSKSQIASLVALAEGGR